MTEICPSVLHSEGLTFPEKCVIIYKSPRESEKNAEKKSPKGVDKSSEVWYNKGVASERRTPRHLEN